MQSRAFTKNKIPFVLDVSSYREDWIIWWTLCQPPWRREKGWPLPRDNENATNWVKFGARGQSGLFLVVISTTWWAYSIRSKEEWVEFDKAVEDLEWVINQVTDSLKALQASQPPAPPVQIATRDDPQKSKQGVAWMTRAAGKRQPKLTRKLLELGGS